jgi:GT2 family glycosyltransferase
VCFLEDVKISAVILNWNNWKDTIDCINDFKSQNAPIEIIVVDNGSSDDSVKNLEVIEGIHLIKHKINDGYGRGNNVGIQYAMNIDSKIILVVNNDIHIPSKDFVNNIISSIKKLPENWGYLGVKISNIDGSIFQYHPVLLPSMFEIFVHNTMLGFLLRPLFPIKTVKEEDDIIETQQVSGACFAFNSKAIKELGAFDPFTFLYGEERILARKYLSAGWQGFIDRSIEVIHNESATTSKIPEFVYIHRLRSEIYYWTKIEKKPKFKIHLWVIIRCLDSFLRIPIRRIQPKTFFKVIEMYKKVFKEMNESE